MIATTNDRDESSPPSPSQREPERPLTSAEAEQVARAVDHISQRWREGIDLDGLARSLNMSRFHFQRVFRSWTGVPPGRFSQLFALREAQRLLDRGRSVLETSLDLGLSGPGRLHDLLVTFEAVTPGEYRKRAADLEIRWGLHDTPLGSTFVAATKRGICHLEFVEAKTLSPPGESAERALQRLRGTWPDARPQRDQHATAELVRPLVDREGLPRALHVRGTNFQIQVWSALLHLPAGSATSYGQLAEAIGRPGAARAVGKAVGNNPVGILIPCHRVLRASGAVGGYRWGETRKRALLARELGLAEEDADRSSSEISEAS